MADTRRETFQVARQPVISGGVHRYQPIELLDEDQLAYALNLDPFAKGTMRRRGGLVSWRIAGSGLTKVDARPRALGQFKARGHPTALVIISDTSGGNSVIAIDDGSASGIKQYTAPHRLSSDCEITQMLNRLYVIQPGQPPLSWEWGWSEFRLEPGMPSCVSACYFQGRAWAVNEDRLFYSDGIFNLDPVTRSFVWHPDTQALDLPTGHAVKIVGHRNQRLLIWTDGGVEMRVPDPNFPFLTPLSILSDNVGCSANHTIVQVGENYFWQDQYGHLRSFVENTQDEVRGILNAPISLAIEEVIDRQTKTALARNRATLFRGWYLWAMCVDGAIYPNEIWAFTKRDKMPFVGPLVFVRNFNSSVAADRLPVTVGDVFGFHFDQDRERCYLLSKQGTTAFLDRAFEGRSEGLRIPVDIQTRGFIFQNPELEKHGLVLRLEGRVLQCPTGSYPSGVTINVQVRVDESAWLTPSLMTLPEITPDGGPRLPATLPFQLAPHSRQHLYYSMEGMPEGRVFQARVQVNDSSCDWEILNLSLLDLENNVRFG